MYGGGLREAQSLSSHAAAGVLLCGLMAKQGTRYFLSAYENC